ncbi:aspartate--tRNA ligase [Kamptonema cortianum]|nr:aspartate--tRNA ligase [Kamptonema cortianum]MDL5044532.1 aspartate--tRNA ligase [Oscillatoria amoena NRMC-F 0135]
MLRSNLLCELNEKFVGQKVVLSGWVDVRRDLGGVIFVDLRDRDGLMQVVFNPQNESVFQVAEHLRSEDVIKVTGTVQKRPGGTENPKIQTGTIELIVEALEILNKSETPPFPLDRDPANEDLRLTYRYLDLRRRPMLDNLKTRHKAALATRNYFSDQGFLEVETPMLFKSTPEGAREYLVPSRLNPGKFYALPQSPQQFKQLLMVSGVEKYFQIARCFRDEDLRADRQPEFTQIDIEMSFITREDIYALVEGLLKSVWKETKGIDIPTPFPRLSFREALDTYGIDKPDRRFGMTLVDLTEEFRQSQFKVFSGVIANGGVIKAINAKGFAVVTTGQLDELTNLAKASGAKGLAFIKVENGEWKSPIVKFFSEDEKRALTEKLKIEEGDLILFAADQWLDACEVLGKIRLRCSDYLQALGKIVIDPEVYDFHWVIDFPLLSYDKETQRYISSHHPFTAPLEEDIPLLESDPLKVRGQHYDIVLNGVELGGGSIRIHQPDIQKKLFEDLLKIPKDVAESRFGYLIRAFRYGALPMGELRWAWTAWWRFCVEQPASAM